MAAISSENDQPHRAQSPPTFPAHDAPRVWFITSGDSPLGTALARTLLAHGDTVFAGITPVFSGLTPAEQNPHDSWTNELQTLVEESKRDKTWHTRLRLAPLDVTLMSQCQSRIAEAISAFGHIDILLCCSSECLVGAIEELGATRDTHTLVRNQFETNYFATVNMIKSVLPHLRNRRSGHIIVVTAITGHLGTPGLGMYCASQWATEGYCDSLAYEIAPFDIKTTIVQPNVEVNVLTNKISAAPPLPAYARDANHAPLFRDILSGLLDRLDGSDLARYGEQLHSDRVVTGLCPPLSAAMKEELLAETVHALAAIGGHENPPARHIVGHDGVGSVREKLKTVSEELEDFVAASLAADID